MKKNEKKRTFEIKGILKKRNFYAIDVAVKLFYQYLRMRTEVLKTRMRTPVLETRIRVLVLETRMRTQVLKRVRSD